MGFVADMLAPIIGKDNAQNIPIIGSHQGQKDAEAQKQNAMQQAIDMYKQKQAAVPGQYHQALQNQLSAYAPVNHLLTQMYGPQAFQKLDYGPGRSMEVQRPVLNLQAPPDPLATNPSPTLPASADTTPAPGAQILDQLGPIGRKVLPPNVKRVLSGGG